MVKIEARPWVAWLPIILYALVILGAAWKISNAPHYSFDTVEYSYLAAKSSGERDWRESGEIPTELASIPDELLAKRAKFYEVKPLFNATVKVAAHWVGPLRAPFAANVIAFVLLGAAVCWAFLAAELPPHWAALTAGLLMVSSVTIETARIGTPDMYATLALVSGAASLFFAKRPPQGLLFLSCSVLVRPDAAILVGALTIAALMQKRISWRTGATAAMGVALLYVFAARNGGSYGELMELTLRGPYTSALFRNLFKTQVAMFAPFAILALIALKDGNRMLVWAVTGALLVRYVLMPHLEDRYLLPYALVVAMAGIVAVFRNDRVSRAA